MVRSIWKGKFVYTDFLSNDLLYKEVILLKNKNIFLFSDFIGIQFYVYNGFSWFIILIDNTMINYNLGCFLFTRMLGVTHNLKKIKKTLQAKKIKNKSKIIVKIKKKVKKKK